AAVGVFVVGGVLSVWRGVESIIAGTPLEDLWVGLTVLFVAAAIDGWSWSVSFRELRRRTPELDVPKSLYLRRSADSTLPAVLLEDTADVLGALLAIAALILHDVTGSAVPDGVASVLIGLMLVGVAGFLGGRSRDLLGLRSVPDFLSERL